MSLKDVNFCRLQCRSFPQILVVDDDVWPAYLKNSSEAGVKESLDSFHSGDGGSPQVSAPWSNTGFTMVFVEDPDFSTGAEER